MKKTAIVLLVAFIIFAIVVLIKNMSNEQIQTKTNSPSTAEQTSHTQKTKNRAYFASLKLGVPYKEIVNEVGEAGRDIGSGIHIFEYTIESGEKVILGFADLEKLLYVKELRANGESVDLVVAQ